MRNVEGEREYHIRTMEMLVRQGGLCCLCGQWLPREQATFEHELGRGMNGGKRDDRIFLPDGSWLNGAAHLLCNNQKGSKFVDYNRNHKRRPMAELKQIPIIPNGKRYWVLPDKREGQTVQVGEYKLSDTAGKKPPPLEGRIVAVGDATEPIFTDLTLTTKPKFVAACKYKFHDLVVFGSYAGNIHTLEGVDYTVLHEEEILGLRIETPFDERDPRDLEKD
jgi:co-chaperonin GroES (HSP10)